METRDRLQYPVPPPLIFLAFLIGALVLNLVVPLPAPWAPVFRVLGALSVIGGWLLGVFALRNMRHLRASPDPDRPPAALVTTGPFRFTRNPLYLSLTLIVLGFTWLAATLWGLLLIPVLLLIVTRVIIRREEAYLRSRFGDPYRLYAARVRRWI